MSNRLPSPPCEIKEKGLPLPPLITVRANEANSPRDLLGPRGMPICTSITRWCRCPETSQPPGSAGPCFAGLGCLKTCCTVWSEAKGRKPPHHLLGPKDTTSNPQQQGAVARSTQQGAEPSPQRRQHLHGDLITARLCANSAPCAPAAWDSRTLTVAPGRIGFPRSHPLYYHALLCLILSSQQAFL